MIPKKIVYDKETLYDNTIKLKQSMNNLLEENVLLKSKIKKLEYQLVKKGKLRSEKHTSELKSLRIIS